MKKFVLALGYFDSLHIGHVKLLSAAETYAKKIGASVTVATFDDGFLSAVGRDEKEVFLLNERKKLLSKIGIFDTLVFPSELSFLSMDKSEFCKYISSLSPSAIFVGSDYRFGNKAEGDVTFLKDNLSCPVFEQEIVFREGVKVSTSGIRNLLAECKIDKVNSLLYFPYFVTGKVKEGRKVGRILNFPTINLIPDEKKALPAPGVYACKVEIDSKIYSAVTNVGTHPTFSDDTFNIESHIIGFSGELYGKEVSIVFCKYLRKIVRFEQKEDLIRQIQSDIERTKEYTI